MTTLVTCGPPYARNCNQKPQICRRNFSDIYHTVGDICTSGLDGHFAISGYSSMSHLFVDTFLEFDVVDNFVYRARVTIILTSDSFGNFGRVCGYDCVLDEDLLLLPILSENVQIPLFTLLPRQLTIFSL